MMVEVFLGTVYTHLCLFFCVVVSYAFFFVLCLFQDWFINCTYISIILIFALMFVVDVLDNR